MAANPQHKSNPMSNFDKPLRIGSLRNAYPKGVPTGDRKSPSMLKSSSSAAKQEETFHGFTWLRKDTPTHRRLYTRKPIKVEREHAKRRTQIRQAARDFVLMNEVETCDEDYKTAVKAEAKKRKERRIEMRKNKPKRKEAKPLTPRQQMNALKRELWSIIDKAVAEAPIPWVTSTEVIEGRLVQTKKPKYTKMVNGKPVAYVPRPKDAYEFVQRFPSYEESALHILKRMKQITK